MTTVQDPICGMAVTEHTAKAKLLYQGQTYYFCSALCKQLFEREPQKYIPNLGKHQHSGSVAKEIHE